ncbi:hypothetical protein DDZ14_16320 [Maritimibacter sp. 55A14]|uniref:hypothetical protein n=1 Tax=Maritimibacter sp. 55A14 TaxID=2174844 RepID=UPI000D620E3B|nr:hypothetical protein [Maritimibacter sp. 55A14]PWE30003.1 hypothetical protein DDZ14_16320 [Maritimibacter sp. 55A14]
MRYKRGKAKAIAHVANGLLQKARAGDTTSTIFYLKTQAGWWETVGLDHAGQLDTGDGRDALAKLLDTIAERQTRIGVPEGRDAQPALPEPEETR